MRRKRRTRQQLWLAILHTCNNTYCCWSSGCHNSAVGLMDGCSRQYHRGLQTIADVLFELFWRRFDSPQRSESKILASARKEYYLFEKFSVSALCENIFKLMFESIGRASFMFWNMLFRLNWTPPTKAGSKVFCARDNKQKTTELLSVVCS